MALPNLHGYWKYSDSVVPFRIKPVDRPMVAQSFIRRMPQSVIEFEEPASKHTEQPAERQLALPLSQSTPTYSKDLEQEEIVSVEELAPEELDALETY